MGPYLLRRLAIAIPSLLGISVVLFTVLALAPGDPFSEMALNPNVPPEVQANLRKQFGLDDPVWQRYFRWLFAMFHGDWGFSFISRVDVDMLIWQRVPVTLAVIGASQFLALAIALPVGIYSAARPYSWFDRIASTLAFVGFSLPTFFTGLLLILLFIFFQYTRIGLAMRAAASVPESARLVGINTSWMIALGWGMATAIGSIAGMLIAPVVFLEPNMMGGVLIYGFAAAVLGGLTSPLGAVIGGFLVGIFENLAGTYIPGVGNELKLPIALALIITVLVVKPAGLFGRPIVKRV